MKIFTTVSISAALLAGAPLAASAAAHSAAPIATADASSVEAGSKVNGEVRKIDKSTQKITIKHEELKHLDMPAMTMVFKVKDPALLDKVKKGDKVEFIAEKVDGQFTVIDIDTAQ